MKLTEKQLAEYVGTYAIWQYLREQENYAQADKWRDKYAEWDYMLDNPFRDGGIEWHPWFASDKKRAEVGK